MQSDILDRPADRKTVLALYGAGLLSAGARDGALGLLRPPLAWWRWTSRVLLLVGAALVLAGVVFFFAWSWAGMSAWTKFGLIECGLVGCVIAAWLVGVDKLAGKVLTLAAAALTGLLLAVYGWTYQTGADSYETFLLWALLIFGWVAIARFGPLWIMWLMALNTGIALYWPEVAMPNETASLASLCIVLTLVNGAALVWREVASRRGADGLGGAWLRYVLLPATLINPTSYTVMFILVAKSRDLPGTLVVLVWLALTGTAFWFYRYRARDIRALSILTFSGCVVALTFLERALWKALFESWGPDSGRDSLERAWEFRWRVSLLGLLIVAVVGCAAWWLRRTSRRMSKES